MEKDYNALATKERELKRLLRTLSEELDLPGIRSLDLQNIGVLKITPPEKHTSNVKTISKKTTGKVITRKTGNIFLNWRKITELIPDIVLAASSAVGAPILLPFVAIYITLKLQGASEELVLDVDATVISALWKHRGGSKSISEEDGFERTNQFRSSLNPPLLPLTNSEFNQAVNRLQDLRCIRLENGIIKLREKVQFRY